MDYKEALDWLSREVARYKEKRPLGSRKYLLMDLIEAVSELTDMLRRDVLERVTREVVLDADTNIDFVEAAAQVLELQLPLEPADEQVAEGAAEAQAEQDGDRDIVACFRSAANSLTRNQLITHWNAALEKLTDVLSQIADMLERPRKDEHFATMFNKETKQFHSSSTGRRARKNYDKWKVTDCGNEPTLEDIEDYRLGKLEHLFATGIYHVNMARRQRFKKYPGEIDFDQMDDSIEMKPVMYKYYAEMRRMVDYVGGDLVPNPVRVGRFFYENRKVKNAKAQRNAFMKYMLKIGLAQEDRRLLLERQAQPARPTKPDTQLNYFAPEKNLKELLRGAWFSELCSDKKYDAAWTDGFVSALMVSEWRDEIARDWSVSGVRNKRVQIKGYVVGLLKDAGVLKGSYDSIARKVGATDDFRVFSRYMGRGKQRSYAKWVEGYVHKG